MKRTGIKSEATLRKYVDNLTLFGLIARQQPDRNKPNRYTFDRNEMQHIIRMNRGKRKKISDNIKLKLHEKKLNEEITKGKIIKLK